MTIDDDDVNRGQLLITGTSVRLRISPVIRSKSRRHLIDIVVRAIGCFVTQMQSSCKRAAHTCSPRELPVVIDKTSILSD